MHFLCMALADTHFKFVFVYNYLLVQRWVLPEWHLLKAINTILCHPRERGDPVFSSR